MLSCTTNTGPALRLEDIADTFELLYSRCSAIMHSAVGFQQAVSHLTACLTEAYVYHHDSPLLSVKIQYAAVVAIQIWQCLMTFAT